jgi:uncharacterized membrane protein YeaQ/YmgE (transglycosylase-associated protein family)
MGGSSCALVHWQNLRGRTKSGNSCYSGAQSKAALSSYRSDSDRTLLGGALMGLLWEIIIGILAGFLAAKIVKGSGMGILLDLLVGIVGSVLGGWVFTLLGLAAYGLIGQLVMATIGAILLLLIIRAIKRA